jgi:F-type H+-transporting ATPase subunit b
MEVSFPTMIYMVVNFILLAAILWYVLYRPLGNLLRAREERIKDDIESAANDRAEAERLRKEYEAKMVQLKRDVHDAIEKARWQGEQERDEIIAKAKEEASAVIQRAMKQIEDERHQAWHDLKDETVDIAMLAASKMLGRIIEEEDQRRMFEEFIQSVRVEKTGELDAAQ